ncbi:MAG: hypothetical protein ACYDHY_18695, partial [Acidiferrobacterales bacterium]
KGAMMSCRNGNGYTGGLSRLDVVKMGDFQVARGGGVWVVVGAVSGHLQCPTRKRSSLIGQFMNNINWDDFRYAL